MYESLKWDYGMPREGGGSYANYEMYNNVSNWILHLYWVHSWRHASKQLKWIALPLRSCTVKEMEVAKKMSGSDPPPVAMVKGYTPFPVKHSMN